MDKVSQNTFEEIGEQWSGEGVALDGWKNLPKEVKVK